MNWETYKLIFATGIVVILSAGYLALLIQQ